jgi:CheY-like chemotaxis protein
MADRPTALIVDRDTKNLALCRCFFESQGYTVYEATDAETAIMLAHGGYRMNVALIALDLGEGITGQELRDSLANLGTSDLTIMVTDNAFARSGHIPKPIDFDELLVLLP